ncbi:hypothetical protein BSN85_16375 [Bradyrhizobium brasilense]|nr:hypothetical protein BSN85_16375 [Bradyrhizobium brasilense]
MKADCAQTGKVERIIIDHPYVDPRTGVQEEERCLGSGWRPLEVASDALERYVAKLEEAAMELRREFTAMHDRPPEEFTFRAQWPLRGEIAVARPKRFDPKRKPDGVLKPNTYAHQFWDEDRRYRFGLARADADLAVLNKRLADRRAPA